VQPRYLFHEGGFYLGVGSLAACNPAHIRRIDSRLVSYTVVNPAVFRNQMSDILRSVAPAVTIAVTVMCHSHSALNHRLSSFLTGNANLRHSPTPLNGCMLNKMGKDTVPRYMYPAAEDFRN